MASRVSRTLLSHVARPALRTSARNAGRRMMSTESHAAKSSDLPWIIGAAVVFGPAALYLLTPSAKDKAHHTVEKSLHKKQETKPPVPATPVPTKDDEGTEVPAAEVEASTQAAFNEDSPKDAQAAEEAKAATPAEAAESAPAAEAASDVPAAVETEKPAESDIGDAKVPKEAAKEA